MIVRAVDEDGDWQFGKGRNDYKTTKLAIDQNIQTRLQSFRSDCFFNLPAGVPWFDLLGEKNLTAVKLLVSSEIADTEGVVKIIQLSVVLNEQRNLEIKYKVETVSGAVDNTFTTDLIERLISQSGDELVDQDGNTLIGESP